VVASYIFVQLFILWLYCAYKTPWWWSQEWLEHIVEE